jgi:AcrR family transcriptional regulator
MSRRDPFAPRKAPQQTRSKGTVDAVFEAMLDIVLKRDFSDPTVQAIAERAGVSVGSVYQYFPSKGALVSGLLRYHLRQRMNQLDASLEAVRGLTGVEAATALVEGLLTEKRARSKLELAMVRYFARAGDLAALTEMDAHMLGSVAGFLRSLGPAIRPVNVEMAAFIISNALRSAVLLSIVQSPSRLEDPLFKQELIRLIVRYLEPDAETGG